MSGRGARTVQKKLAKVRNLFFAEDYAAAEAICREALAIAPTDATAWFWLALTLMDQNKTESALHAFGQALEFDPSMIGAQMNSATLLMDMGEFARADKVLRHVMREYPDRYPALPLRVRSLLGLGKGETAARVARRAVKVVPDPLMEETWADSLNRMGIELARAGLNETAEKVLLRAVEFSPDVAPYDNLGIVYGAMERPLDALLAFLRAIEMDPTSARVYYNLGRELSNLGPAVAAYRRAIALDPNYPEAYNNLGKLLYQLGRYDEAEASWREAVARYGDAYSHAELAAYLYDRQRFEEAEREARSALDLEASEPLALRVLGDCYATRGEYAEAQQCFEEALTQSPDWWELRWSLACLCALNEDKTALLQALTAALHDNCAQTLAAFHDDQRMDAFRDDVDVQALLHSAGLFGSISDPGLDAAP